MATEIAELKERKVALLVEDLRLWILSQPHLNSRTEDAFLRGFLRGCFYELGETKRRIELYYTLKNEIPSVLAGRRVSRRLLDVCRTGVTIALPMLIHGKRARIHLSKYTNYNPDNYEYAEVMKVFFMLTEIQMMESRNEVPCNVVHIVDLKEATFKHCLQFDFGLIRRIMRLIKAGLPYHMDEIHIINASNYIIWLLCVLTSFMSEKIRGMYHMHNSMESFYKHIPRKFLPIEYGGQNGSIQRTINEQVEKLIEYKDYFEDDDSYGVNEVLRRRKS